MSQALKSSAINPFLFMKIKQLCFVSGVALATLATAGAAQAALVIVPADLAPGAQYRLVFVTDGTRDATSSDINDYNTFVTNQVTGSPLATALTTAGFNLGTITWKAIGSTSATSAKVNTSTDGSQPDVPIGVVRSEEERCNAPVLIRSIFQFDNADCRANS
jgi:hypothetical protein